MSPTAPEIRRRTLLLLVAACAVCAALTACGSSSDPAPQEARTYRLRGAVRGTDGELTLQHEAIPDFVGPGGETEPMHAMTMSFPVAPDIDLEPLSPGAPVEVDLRIAWDASPPALVTAVRVLPEGTELELAGR